MATEREIAFAMYWEGKHGRKLTVEIVRDAYLAGWSDRPMTNPTPDLDRAIREAVEWRDMATAPLDGTRVIVKTPCFYWNSDVCQHLARGEKAVEARYATSPGRPEPHWIEWCGDKNTYSSSWIVAEAWMPLPAAIRKDQP